jgi:glycosyltransferase involved in cell wall biosynthesis
MYTKIAQGVGGEFKDWLLPVNAEYFRGFDKILVQAGSPVKVLIYGHQVPREKIFAVSHSEEGSFTFLQAEGGDNNLINRYGGYGVVSDTLACSSLSMGITRVPTVLRQGVDCSHYHLSPPQKLKTVGYAAVFCRPNVQGVEIKRGELVRIAVEQAGLEFKPAIPGNDPTKKYYQQKIIAKESMPEYYRSVDCVIMSSLMEGGSMVMYEAAAAGRLVIGTPTGDFPRLCYEGQGILAPLNEDAFVRFTRDTLIYYKNNPEEFQAKCTSIQQAVRTNRDWPRVMDDWRNFVGVT